MCNGRASVGLSVSSACRPLQQRASATGLLPGALREGDVDPIDSCGRRRSDANAGSVILRADEGGSLQTCAETESIGYREQNCADTIGTVPVRWTGHL